MIQRRSTQFFVVFIFDGHKIGISLWRLQGFKVVIRDISLHMSNRVMDYCNEDIGLCRGALETRREPVVPLLKTNFSSVQEFLESSQFVQASQSTRVRAIEAQVSYRCSCGRLIYEDQVVRNTSNLEHYHRRNVATVGQHQHPRGGNTSGSTLKLLVTDAVLPLQVREKGEVHFHVHGSINRVPGSL